MSDSSDDDLPDVGITLQLPESPSKIHKVKYQIDLTREIQIKSQTIEQELKHLKASEEASIQEQKERIANENYQKDLINSLSKIEVIPDEAPGREFIKSNSSFCQFNEDTLVKPIIIKHANHQDYLLFYQHVRNILQDSSVSVPIVEDYQEVLKYILFLASVHSDEFIVECCTELLLEFNRQWEINHTLLLAIFQNWGADISQVLPSYPSVDPKLQVDPPKTVPCYNVNSVLQVLTGQLKLRKKIDYYNVTTEFGLWNVDELVFSILVFLSLDSKYIGCIPALQECVGELLTGVSEITGGEWASEFSHLLLGLEEDNYNLTQVVCRLLTGSVASETLQRNVCFAAIQRIRKVPPSEINHNFDYYRFEDLIRETTKLTEHEPIHIYCLLIFIDTIVRHPKVTSQETFRIFFKWLTRFERRVKANAHISALISHLSSLWDRETNPPKEI